MTTEQNDNTVNRNVLAKEMAEKEFERFADLMDLDVDETAMDEDDLKGFVQSKKKFISALQNGALIVNENGEAVYTPRNSKTPHTDAIVFHERTGESLACSKKPNGKNAHMYAPMGNITKLHPSVFVKMAGIDIKTCEAIFALLMD